MLLRAGFTLEMEDETDRRQTHVEFVATHQVSGAKFSVEAKRREGVKIKVNRLLHSALTKRADHACLVFIDTNDGRLETHKYKHLSMRSHHKRLIHQDPPSSARCGSKASIRKSTSARVLAERWLRVGNTA